MSAIARQRNESSPQKHKAIRQPSFSDLAEAESKVEEDRKKKEDDAAKKREERRRLDDLQRRKDDDDAEEAARRIADSASRFARLKLEEQQRLQQVLRQDNEAPQLMTPTLSATVQSPQWDEPLTPSRVGATSPLKKYLRNELRSACDRCFFSPF
jgi:hypothetical protein